MNTKEDMACIAKHCHNLPTFAITPLIEYINIIASKLDEYSTTILALNHTIDEKQKIIDRFIDTSQVL